MGQWLVDYFPICKLPPLTKTLILLPPFSSAIHPHLIPWCQLLESGQNQACQAGQTVFDSPPVGQGPNSKYPSVFWVSVDRHVDQLPWHGNAGKLGLYGLLHIMPVASRCIITNQACQGGGHDPVSGSVPWHASL